MARGLAMRKRKPAVKATPTEPIEELYEERIVVFLDVLGFTSQVAASTDDPTAFVDVFGLLEVLIRVVEQLHEIIDRFAVFDVRSTTFSDNIVISAAPNWEELLLVLTMIREISKAGFEMCFPVRGGMTIGPIYHSSNMVMGPAMIEAYKMEREIAVVPRTVLDESVLLRLSDTTSVSEKEKNQYLGWMLRTDVDHRQFVKYWIPHGKELCVQNMLETDLSERAKLKWAWLLGQAEGQPAPLKPDELRAWLKRKIDGLAEIE